MKRIVAFLVMTLAICMLLCSCQTICKDSDLCEIFEDIFTFNRSTVTFDTDGAGTVKTQKVFNGEKVQEPAIPEKEGHNFAGWYLDGEIWSFADGIVTEDMTLTAKWTPKSYTVKFVDENKNLYHSISIAYGIKLSAPHVPERSDCEFLGWFNGNVMWDFSSTPVTQDLILQMKWVAGIVYVLDGGVNNIANPDVVYSSDKLPISLQNPRKDGYYFLGWYSDPNMEQRIYNIATCKAKIIYAAWTTEPIPTPPTDPSNNDPTLLRFQLTDNSNSGELPTSSRRFLAGDTYGVKRLDTIDRWVAERNEDALHEAGVTVEYLYLPDSSAYGWGMNIDTIDAEVKSKQPGRPDIYSNFIYDMVAVSLKGAFANLLSTTMHPAGHQYAGKNYFKFAKRSDLIDTGDGYMMDYMRSLTLSKSKMYCLASDYFIDLVKAFTVVPVNISLLETLETSGSYADGKGDFLADRVTTYADDGSVETNYTVEDLYQLVEDMEWNYETLAKFSAAICSEGSEGDGSTDLRDTVGFALGTDSDLSASGMLYTTSITVINRAYDADKGDYTYSYPYVVQKGEGANASFTMSESTHNDLITFCNNLNTLFSSKGVIAVSSEDTFGYGDTDLQAIRTRFASGNVLFGGVICLGSLENEEYMSMHTATSSGYGILPVPLYRTNYYDESTGEIMVDRYVTNIHSVGKIGAISATTEKFALCTAYLNYQSTHSEDVLLAYYHILLLYDIVGAYEKGNIKMLQYILYNVRSSFDKTFEDALGKYYSATDEEAMKQQWHTMIKNAGYKITDMDGYYASLTPTKAWRLYNLENSIYPTLPD